MNDEIRGDLKELKVDVKELVKLGAVHNELLKTHEARSIALQEEQKILAAKLAPVERHVWLVTIILNALGALALAVLGKIVLSALQLI